MVDIVAAIKATKSLSFMNRIVDLWVVNLLNCCMRISYFFRIIGIAVKIALAVELLVLKKKK